MSIFVCSRSNADIVSFLCHPKQSRRLIAYDTDSCITQCLKHVNHIIGIAIDAKSQGEIPLSFGNRYILAPSATLFPRMEMYSCIRYIHAMERAVFVLPLLVILLAVEIKSCNFSSLTIIAHEDFLVRFVCEFRLRFRTIFILGSISLIEQAPEMNVSSERHLICRPQRQVVHLCYDIHHSL